MPRGKLNETDQSDLETSKRAKMYQGQILILENLKALYDFDPRSKINETLSTKSKIELKKRRQQLIGAEKSSKERTLQLRQYGTKISSGIKSLTNKENIAKGIGAIARVTSAVSKFSNTEESDNKALNYLSGTIDIIDGVASCLKPPASAITGIFSSIVNMIIPSRIEQQFDQLSNQIQLGFQEQQMYLQKMFAFQSDFITQEFGLLKEHIDSQTLRETMVDVDAITKKMKYIKLISDPTVLFSEVKFIEVFEQIDKIESTINWFCLDKFRSRNGTTSQAVKRICTSLLYADVTLNFQVETVLAEALATFSTSGTTDPSLQTTISSYFDVLKKRLQTKKTWMRKTFKGKDFLTCSMLLDEDAWLNRTLREEYLNFANVAEALPTWLNDEINVADKCLDISKIFTANLMHVFLKSY